MAVAGFYVFNEAVANDAAALAGKEYVTVPNVQGRHQDEAKKLLQDAGLSMGAPNRVLSSKVAPDYVVFQRPAPGEVVRAGRRVYPTVSKGTAYVQVPSVVNLLESEARERLTAASLGIASSVSRIPSNLPEETVISQYPPPNMEVASNSVVSLLLSQGAIRGVRVLVPDLKDLPLKEARKRITDIGLQLRIVPDTTANAPVDIVLKQFPEAGSEMVPGEKVAVNVKSSETVIDEVEHRVELRYPVPQGFEDRNVEIFTIGRDGSRSAAFPQAGGSGKVPPGATVRVSIRYVDEMTFEVFLDGKLTRRYYYSDGNPTPRVTDF